MSTFLELVNDLREKCGISGNALTTLASVTGESLRCKNWINDAYTAIQRKHQDWMWLRTDTSFTTVASQQTYTLSDIGISATFGMWKPDSFRVYVTSSGYPTETFLGDPIDYDMFRNLWQFGANRTTEGRPVQFTITPAKSLAFGPTPDATGYTIVGEHYTMPVELSADADEPAFPAKFHQIIVFNAMMSYGAYESAPEVFQRGEQRYNTMIAELESDQLPQSIVLGTLA